MKYLNAILAVFVYMPVTYSNNAGPPSLQPELQKYVNNIPSTYQSNGQVLQLAPFNVPISNPTATSNGINQSQPPPIQYPRIGPTFTYQAPQNVPVTQNTVQRTNLQKVGTGSASRLPAPPLQYSPNLNLKAIYEATKPTKQYTIVHTNGTVEQTDDLQAIVARHPNFVMLRAGDVLANKYVPVQNIGIPQKLPPVQTASVPIQTPVTTGNTAIAPNQNVGWASTNSYQGAYKTQQQIPNSQAASMVSNQSPIYQSSLNVKSQQPATGAAPVPISPTASFQQPIPPTQQQTQRNPTNAYLGGSNSQSTIQNSNGSVVPTIPNTVSAQTVSSIPNNNWGSLSNVNILPINQQNGNQQNQYNPNPKNQAVRRPVTGHLYTKAIASNPSSVYQPVHQQNTPIISPGVLNVSTTISQGKYDNLPTTNTTQNAFAANPLPIYPETYEPKTAIKPGIINKPFAVGAAVAQSVKAADQPPLSLPNNYENIILQPQIIKDKNEAIVALNSNVSIPYTDVQNRSYSITLPASTNPIQQKPLNVSEPQTLPILLPEVQPQNTTQEKIAPTITQEINQPEVTKNKTVNEVNLPYNIISIANQTTEPITKITSAEASTVLEPISKKIVDSSTPNNTNVTGTNAQPINSTNLTTNNTNTPEIVKELTNKPTIDINKANSTIPSVPSESSTLSTDDKPWSWLTVKDDSIWDLIRNNTQNIYFFFMPPRPKVTKESKTIIYANGTTVEEVTETLVDVAPDGEPKMTITTTKSYS